MTMQPQNLRKRRLKSHEKDLQRNSQFGKAPPTGSVLAFQILSPILTHQGQCRTVTSKILTLLLILLGGLSCFLLCLTDSFRDDRGKVRYGIATVRGLWVIDAVNLSAEEAARYRLKLTDFFHAFMSLLVFGAVALFDSNVNKCFWPTPSEELKDILALVPVGIGVLCSILFLIFPSKRHGIGSPLSRN
ncbi:hypothetical protein K2173_014363 [Erythroxylum novogranatense]|uniref:Uncharacterized protein n=1 Tax=Erythroxylum novogranatense TaxID=1862640 RepID=A0AAV8S5L6_9ROSI|nr:hypothetical protein K2173_014363 [Erythroxylum novogranatense]